LQPHRVTARSSVEAIAAPASWAKDEEISGRPIGKAAIKRLEEIINNLQWEQRKQVLAYLTNLRALETVRKSQESASCKRRAEIIAKLLKRATRTPPTR